MFSGVVVDGFNVAPSGMLVRRVSRRDWTLKVTGGRSLGSLLYRRLRRPAEVGANVSRLPGLVTGGGGCLVSAKIAMASSVRLRHMLSVRRRTWRSETDEVPMVLPVPVYPSGFNIIESCRASCAVACSFW